MLPNSPLPKEMGAKGDTKEREKEKQNENEKEKEK
jgi:hypothetical protein